jgi:hypothetical protein
MAFGIQDTMTVGFIVINIILTILLVVVYTKNYKAIKSKMTLGLLFFALMFLVENLIDFYFYNLMIVQLAFDFTTIHFMVNLIEMVGLLVLSYVTWR